MAEEPAKPRMSLEALFQKAGLPVPGSVGLKSMKREYQCLRYAQCYVEAHFNAREAYAMFNPRCASSRRAFRESKWLTGPETGPRIAFHVRNLVQAASERARQTVMIDLQQILMINQAIITTDATDLIEQVQDPATNRVFTRFKAAHRLTPEQRMAVKSYRIRDGEVTHMEMYDRLAAVRLHLEVMTVLDEKGGSDQNWMGNWKAKVIAARSRKITMELEAIERRKVIDHRTGR